MPHPSFGNRCSPFTFGQITKRCLMNVLSNLTCWALHGYIARIWCKETVYQLLSYYYKPSGNQTWQWTTIPIYRCFFFPFQRLLIEIQVYHPPQLPRWGSSLHLPLPLRQADSHWTSTQGRYLNYSRMDTVWTCLNLHFPNKYNYVYIYINMISRKKHQSKFNILHV